MSITTVGNLLMLRAGLTHFRSEAGMIGARTQLLLLFLSSSRRNQLLLKPPTTKAPCLQIGSNGFGSQIWPVGHRLSTLGPLGLHRLLCPLLPYYGLFHLLTWLLLSASSFLPWLLPSNFVSC